MPRLSQTLANPSHTKRVRLSYYPLLFNPSFYLFMKLMVIRRSQPLLKQYLASTRKILYVELPL